MATFEAMATFLFWVVPSESLVTLTVTRYCYL